MYEPKYVNGVKQQYTESTTEDYSTWHRKLSKDCFAMDFDWVEYRSGRGIVALIECTKITSFSDNMTKLLDIIKNRIKFQAKVVNEAATKLGVPAYYVIHDESLKNFLVMDIKNSLAETRMSEDEYKKFIEGL